MTRPRRTQRRTDGHRKHTPGRTYTPHGGVAWPTLGDGTMYRPDLPVILVRQDGDYDLEWRGRLLWVNYTEDGDWVPPTAKGGRTEDKARWKAVVDWGQGARPPGTVWVDELEVDTDGA